jgi:hypothetical protein
VPSGARGAESPSSKDDQAVPYVSLVYLAAFILTLIGKNAKDRFTIENQREAKRLHVNRNDLTL